MTTRAQGPKSAQTLVQQIDAAERRILRRRKSLGVHGAGLVRGIQEQLASPGILWWAAGLGFLLGEVTRDKVETSQTTVQSLGRMVVTWMPLLRILLTASPPRQGSEDSTQSSFAVDPSGSSTGSSLETPP